MRKLFNFLFLFPLAVTSYAQVSLNVIDFGAIGDGATLNTTFIQQAIDSCFSAGGGEVIIPGGNFKSNTIILKSEVTLRVQGTLIAITGLGNFPEIPYNQASWSDTYTKKSLIFAEEANHIRITGGGTIKGSGQDLSVLEETNMKARPFGLRIHKCVGVTIDSIRLENAPQWMVHVQRSDSVVIRSVSIFNHGFYANDGIDIDACKHVLIEDCDVDSNDDPIVIKSHSEDESSNILVRRCTVATFERAVKVGNESLGAFKNIRFEDITVNATAFPLPILPQTAIYLAVADGGSADSISFERINITTAYETPIFIRLNDRGISYNGSDPPVQFLRNVLIKDVECIAGSTIPCSISAIPGYYVKNIVLENIHITLPGNGPIAIVPVPELENDRPENNMWGEILPAYGFYIRHVKNMIADSVCFTQESPDYRAEYWMEDTANIVITNGCLQSSVNENASASASLIAYPNPAGDELFLNLENGTIKKLALFDVLGKFYTVEKWWNSETQAIQLHELNAGIYWLQAENEKGEKKMMRFIKK